MSVAESVIRSAMVRRRWDRGWRSTGPHCSNFGSAGSTPTDRSGFRSRRGGGVALPQPVVVLRLRQGHSASPPRRHLRRVVECNEHLADLHGLPGLDVDTSHATTERGWDLDRGLVGLDLEKRRVLGDDLALVDEDLDDLGLGQTLTQVGQRERPGHGPQKARVSRAAVTTRGTPGTFAFSRAKPTNGTSYAATRRTGASSERNAPSMIEAAISAPGPKLRAASG